MRDFNQNIILFFVSGDTVRVLVIPLLPTMTNEHIAITPVTFTAGLEGGILSIFDQPSPTVRLLFWWHLTVGTGWYCHSCVPTNTNREVGLLQPHRWYWLVQLWRRTPKSHLCDQPIPTENVYFAPHGWSWLVKIHFVPTMTNEIWGYVHLLVGHCW